MTSLGRVDHTQEDFPVLDALWGLSLLLLQFVDKSIKGFGALRREELRLHLESGSSVSPRCAIGSTSTGGSSASSSSMRR